MDKIWGFLLVLLEVMPRVHWEPPVGLKKMIGKMVEKMISINLICCFFLHFGFSHGIGIGCDMCDDGETADLPRQWMIRWSLSSSLTWNVRCLAEVRNIVKQLKQTCGKKNWSIFHLETAIDQNSFCKWFHLLSGNQTWQLTTPQKI